MCCRCCEKDLPVEKTAVCPECFHTFKGTGWEGLEPHWRAHHGSVMSYEKFRDSLCQAHWFREDKIPELLLA